MPRDRRQSRVGNRALGKRAPGAQHGSASGQDVAEMARLLEQWVWEVGFPYTIKTKNANLGIGPIYSCVIRGWLCSIM